MGTFVIDINAVNIVNVMESLTYPFKNGKCLAWDNTWPNSLGPTHIKDSTSKEAGKAASLAEVGKLKKYKHPN